MLYSLLLLNMEEKSVLIPKIELENSQPVPDPIKKSKVVPILLSILGFFVLVLIYLGVSGFLIYKSGLNLYKSAQNLEASVKSQDLNKVKTDIDTTKNDLAKFKSNFNLIAWTKILPFVGSYVSDASHAINAGLSGLDAGKIVITAVEPLSDLLGLKGGNAATSGEKTAQERIDFIIGIVPELIPQMDKISGNIKTIQSEISQINPDRYPEKYNGKPIRSLIVSAQELISEASTFVVNGKPVLENLPYYLGIDSPRTYLVLFQNDKELRPTGGFLTGYAVMKVDKAKFEPTSSDDIYNLDAKYKPVIPAPEPIVKYIKGPYVLSKNLRLRDMNWSPDFNISMDTFNEAISKVGINNVDGIIAVDTQLLENLLNVIGPIGVTGFGNFSTQKIAECNCSQVIHELESFADIEGPIIWDPLTGKIIQRPPNSDNRKRIIGPLMNSILANAMGQPKEKLAPLFEAGFRSLMEKHVMVYMMDKDKQKSLNDFGIGGVIRDYQGDYLHINDANLGGRKSNLYATSEVEQNIEIAKNGEVVKTVTITYKNPQKQDGWLNSVLPTWVRVYVPKGSTLIASEGLSEKSDPYEDLGKTVYAGFFQLRPEGLSKITFKYKLPFKFNKDYKMLIQKQPGTNGFLYTINLGNHSEEFLLKTDKEVKISL